MWAIAFVYSANLAASYVSSTGNLFNFGQKSLAPHNWEGRRQLLQDRKPSFLMIEFLHQNQRATNVGVEVVGERFIYRLGGAGNRRDGCKHGR